MFIRNWQTATSWLVLGALPACQHAAVVPVASNGATASAIAAPTPPASVAAATPASHATVPSEPEDAPELSPFIDGVRLGYAARLSVAGKGAVLATDKLLFGIHDERVTLEPALLEGLHPQRSQFVRVFGSLPDAAWAVEETYMERTSRASLSRWTGNEWVSADAMLQNKNVVGISSWSAGRTLALVGDGYTGTLGFSQLGGKRGVPLPELDRTPRNSSGCAHGIVPTAMTALSTGEVFLAGTQCKTTPDDGMELQGTAVERWGAGQTRGKLSTLPLLSEAEASSAELTSLVAASASDVFVAGSRVPMHPEGQEMTMEAYLAHFDGQAWRTLPAPPIERIEELQRAPDGKLWARSGGELWATTGAATDSATWNHIAMPQLAEEAGGGEVSSFWVRGVDDVWATVGSNGFSYLIRTKRDAAPLSVPPDAQVAELSTAFDPMAAYDCAHPTLVLLTLSRQAPKDADAPSVRALLRGHSEFQGKTELVEFSLLARRYLGVRGDLDVLQEVEQVLSRSNIAGVTPELRCLTAPATRTLAVEYAAQKPSTHARASASGAEITRKLTTRLNPAF